MRTRTVTFTILLLTTAVVMVAAQSGNELPGDRRAIAEFVSGKSFGAALNTTPSAQARCPAATGDFSNPLAGPAWNGWGVNTSNTRYQDGPAA